MVGANVMRPAVFDSAGAIAAVEDEIRRSLTTDDAAVASLYAMMRYHMGWANADLEPDNVPGGKRLRPLLCLLCCAAEGGDPAIATPAAAAIELLHNFTLVHDDIQDHSAFRRHRRTVWSLWGMAQGITVGDGMHVLAARILRGLRDRGVPADRVLDLAAGFDATVLRICEGQYEDIGFESRWDITATDYLHMIGGKTAAIFGFAAGTGAALAGADTARAAVYTRLGTALGLGFQVRDDILGIWGDPAVTGKETGDDIRRRKRSLPIVMLHERLNPADRFLESAYAAEEVPPDSIAAVMRALDDTQVRAACETTVTRFHHEAAELLTLSGARGPAADALAELIERMAGREG